MDHLLPDLRALERILANLKSPMKIGGLGMDEHVEALQET